MKTYSISIILGILIFSVTNSFAQTRDNFFEDKILIVLHMQEDSANITTESDLGVINNMNKLMKLFQ